MAPPSIPSDALYASPRFKSYAITTDIDLVAAGGGPCRSILIRSTGALELVPASPLDGQTSDVIGDLTAGVRLEVQANKVLSAGTTNGLKITVFW